MLRRTVRFSLSFAALLAATACAGTDARGSRTVRDSVGIEIVENIRPGSALAPFALDSVPVIDLGGDPDDPHEEFSGFVFPVRLADGSLVVANSGSRRFQLRLGRVSQRAAPFVGHDFASTDVTAVAW